VNAPAGPCEWCGGPQNWTIHAGEMYVRCIGGCLPLFDEEVVIPPPLILETLLERVAISEMELSEGWGVVPFVGGDADEKDRTVLEVSEPGEAWLSTLWEGGSYGEE